MSVLTTERRKKLSTKTFGVIQKVKGRSGKTLTKKRFPMPDKLHAATAKSYLGRAKGLSSGEKARIRTKANRILYGQSKPPEGRS